MNIIGHQITFPLHMEPESKPVPQYSRGRMTVCCPVYYCGPSLFVGTLNHFSSQQCPWWPLMKCYLCFTSLSSKFGKTKCQCLFGSLYLFDNNNLCTLSILSGRFVAATMVTSCKTSTPSISVRSWASTRSETSPPPLPPLKPDIQVLHMWQLTL